MDWGEYLPRVVEALIIAFILWVTRFAWVARKESKARDHKLDKLLEYHEGVPADPITGQEEMPGVATQLKHLHEQVTPNGGDSDTMADRVVRTEGMAAKALTQGSTNFQEIKKVQDEQDRVGKHLERSEIERRQIMRQSLEGWKKFEEILGIDAGDPPWIEWTKDDKKGDKK